MCSAGMRQRFSPKSNSLYYSLIKLS
jgi:hypothetical protein